MEAMKIPSKVVIAMFLFLWLPAIVRGSTQKLQGVVRDNETGQPLQGALVEVRGTGLVCRTDKQGIYILTDVPTGKQTLVVDLEGYKKKKVKNVMVYPDQTTNLDIVLFRITAQAPEHEGTATEKSWVKQSDGYQVWSLNWTDIEKLPVRELSEIVTLFPGVINHGEDLHIFGGRSDENGWRVDNVSARLPMSGRMGMRVIPNAIETLSFFSGHDATIGSGMSSEFVALTKTGESKFHLTGEIISDDFWALKDQNYEILGINKLYSYGYNDYVLTASGPVPGITDLQFYIAGRHVYQASPATQFEGWNQDSLIINRTWYVDRGKPYSTEVKDSINLYADIPRGRLPGGGQAANTISGNFIWARKPFHLKLGGSYFWGHSNEITTGDPLDLYVTSFHGRQYRFKDYSGYIDFQHQVSSTFHYELNLTTFYSGSQDGDPDYWDDFLKPGDPVYNSAMADTGIIKRWYLPIGLSVGAPGGNVGSFNKFDESYIGAKLNAGKQFGKNIAMTFGGEFNYYTARRYSIQTIGMLNGLTIAERAENLATGLTDYQVYRQYGSVQNFGYDIYGNKINQTQTYQTNVNGSLLSFNGHDGPPHPIIAGSYIQGKIELKNLVINGGIRFDLFDTGTDHLKNLDEIQKDSTGFISREFYAQIGRYATMPRLSDVFESWGYFAQTLFTGDQRQFPNPNLKPVKLTQYEMGWLHSLGKKGSLGITAFYKSYSDLAGTAILKSHVPWYGTIVMTQNYGFTNVKGFSINFNLNRTKGIKLTANYTLSYVNGTGSESDSYASQALSQEEAFLPILVAPVDFDQRHRGMINIDIRTHAKYGSKIFGTYPLANMGLNMLLSFHSGEPFTRIQSGEGFSQVYGYQNASTLESTNASNLPWFYQLDAKLDKTFSIGIVDFNVYLWIINVLNTKSITAVFGQTARPDSDGFLGTDYARKSAAGYPAGEAEWRRWYQALLTNCGTFGWQTPRQVRLGVKFEL
jgi:outer membrane receptor protein involved in Fe transport